MRVLWLELWARLTRPLGGAGLRHLARRLRLLRRSVGSWGLFGIVQWGWGLCRVWQIVVALWVAVDLPLVASLEGSVVGEKNLGWVWWPWPRGWLGFCGATCGFVCMLQLLNSEMIEYNCFPWIIVIRQYILWFSNISTQSWSNNCSK